MLDWRGPAILARTMSVATCRGKSATRWQYHSRSDNHSKVACWTVLFDLLTQCDAVGRLAREGRLGFRINHVLVGPINKTLDLVLTLVDPDRDAGLRSNFAAQVDRYGIVLDPAERKALESLPLVLEDLRSDVHEVAVALEAKACMTEHGKSIPRLHAEILATGYLARLAAPRCITVSYNLVNAAPTFVSSEGKGKVNKHKQPTDAKQVVDMLGKAIPLARTAPGLGYDVIGVSVLECANDGTPVVLSTGGAAPATSAHTRYERMMVALCSEFRNRFR